MACPTPALPSGDLAVALSEVTFVVLDLETTGTVPAQNRIIEIGAARYRGGELLGTFQTLVNPGCDLPPFITVLTGISEALLAPAPSLDEVLPALLDFIGDAVLVGHNLRFDTSFLDAALLARGRPRLGQARVDTLTLARRFSAGEVPNFRLGTLALWFRAATAPTHRALDDALATADVFHALLDRAGSFGVTALDDLLVLGAPPGRRRRLARAAKAVRRRLGRAVEAFRPWVASRRRRRPCRPAPRSPPPGRCHCR